MYQNGAGLPDHRHSFMITPATASTAQVKDRIKSLTKAYPKLFVAGCPRSGTTWTANMICRHPQVIKLNGESHLYKLLYDPFTYLKSMPLRKRIDRRRWIVQHYGATPILTGFNSRNLWNGLLRTYRFYEWSGEKSGPHMVVDYKTFKDLVRRAKAVQGDELTKVSRLIESNFDASFYGQGGDRNRTMLEKTPMHIKFAGAILRAFPEAKMIEIVRDIRSVCASWQARANTQRWARKPTAQLVAQWISCIEKGDRVQKDPVTRDRVLRIKYEDLRQDPHTWLSRAFDFAALSISPAQLSETVDALSIEKATVKGEGLHVRQGKVQGWKEELSAADIEICQRMAGPLLDRLGYSA